MSITVLTNSDVVQSAVTNKINVKITLLEEEIEKLKRLKHLLIETENFPLFEQEPGETNDEFEKRVATETHNFEYKRADLASLIIKLL